MLAAYTLLDLEKPCHQNENNPASDRTHCTDNNVNEQGRIPRVSNVSADKVRFLYGYVIVYIYNV